MVLINGEIKEVFATSIERKKAWPSARVGIREGKKSSFFDLREQNMLLVKGVRLTRTETGRLWEWIVNLPISSYTTSEISRVEEDLCRSWPTLCIDLVGLGR